MRGGGDKIISYLLEKNGYKWKKEERFFMARRIRIVATIVADGVGGVDHVHRYLCGDSSECQRAAVPFR